MAEIRVVPNNTELERLLRSPTGGVARLLSRRAIAVRDQAVIIMTEDGLVDTGRARASIAWRLGTDALGLFALIGSRVTYFRYLEEGTRPHEIRPRNKKALFWKGAQHPVRLVHHPGTRAYRVLERALRRAL